MENFLASYRSVSEIDFLKHRKVFNGVPILDVSTVRLLDIIKDIKSGQAELMVTPNIDHLRLLDEGQHAFIKAYENSALIVCDSRVIRLVSRLIPGDVLENVNPGSDITRKLFDCSWFVKSKIAVIGSCQNDVCFLKEKFLISDISVHVPPMGFISNEVYIKECLDFVLKTDPDYLLIAVGCPQGEMLANRISIDLKGRLAHLKLSLCVGASIDFLVGKQKRAPVIFQYLGIEWLYRLATNFSRLRKRYYLDFIWLLGYFIKSLRGVSREV